MPWLWRCVGTTVALSEALPWRWCSAGERRRSPAPLWHCRPLPAFPFSLLSPSSSSLFSLSLSAASAFSASAPLCARGDTMATAQVVAASSGGKSGGGRRGRVQSAEKEREREREREALCFTQSLSETAAGTQSRRATVKRTGERSGREEGLCCQWLFTATSRRRRESER